MTKADVIKEIVHKTGVDKIDAMETLEAFFKVVKDNMIEGKNIYIRGFGSFTLKKKAQKVARNISRNTAIILPAHFAPNFKPSQSFVKRIQERGLNIYINKDEGEKQEEQMEEYV